MDRNNYEAEISLEKKHWWYVTRRLLLKKICDIYLDKRKKLNILEIGCGSGGNFRFLSGYGELCAMETNNNALKHARSKNICEVRHGKLPYNIPYNRTFDIICLFDVLEHIQDDKLSLDNIYKYLNTNGKIILTVPAYMFLWSGHDIASHHKRRYNKNQIIHLLQTSGFTIDYSSYFFSVLLPIIAFVRFIQRIFYKNTIKHDIRDENKILNYLLIKIFSVESNLIPNISLPFGVSFISVGVKKSSY